MLEKEPAKSAEAKPKDKAKTAPRAMTATAAKLAPRTAGREAAAARRPRDMYERIQLRAYELWESEGRPAGREHAHWLQAESEIARARTQRAGMSR